MRIQWHGGPGNVFSAEGLTMAPGAVADVDDELAERLLANPLMSRADEPFDNPLAFPTTNPVPAAGLQPGLAAAGSVPPDARNETIGAGATPAEEKDEEPRERPDRSARKVGEQDKE